MPYQATLHYDLPIFEEGPEGRSLREVRQGSIENPYSNYLTLLRHLLALATDAPRAELLRFADCGGLQIDDSGGPWSRYSLLLLQWTAGPEKPGWYDFDAEDFAELLKEPLLAPCFDGEAFRNLDYYLTALVELRLLRELPASRPVLQKLWIYEELMDFYWDTFPLRRILAEAYKLMGWQWFCLDAETEPLHFRGGLLAALSLLATEPESEHQILADLISIHDQLVLTAGSRLTDPLLAELRSSLQEGIDQLTGNS
ncbi:MAG: hypothetical protein ACAI44_31010 [Candidatus Sericytochromatia bacterium]